MELDNVDDDDFLFGDDDVGTALRASSALVCIANNSLWKLAGLYDDLYEFEEVDGL